MTERPIDYGRYEEGRHVNYWDLDPERRVEVERVYGADALTWGRERLAEFVQQRLLRDAQVLPIWEGASNVLALDVLRALDREDAHEPLLAAIQARLDAADHPALRDEVETVREASHDLAEAMATLATEDAAYAQLQSKRLADLIFDVFTAALLVEEAQAGLDGERAGDGDEAGDGARAGDARKALVARRFVDRELRERDARGITSGDRLPIEGSDAIVRFASVDPAALVDTATSGMD